LPFREISVGLGVSGRKEAVLVFQAVSAKDLPGELGSADEQLGGGMLLLGKKVSLCIGSGERQPLLERLPQRAPAGVLSLCWGWSLSGVQEDVWGIKRAVATSSGAMCPCGIAKTGTACIACPGEAVNDEPCGPGEIFTAMPTWLWLFIGGDPTGAPLEPNSDEELEMRVGVGAWAMR